ncbi:hypothetical protein V5O48_002120 [Marasmius crinis-equi]|uniref:Uncharacterized protein n=1 Tax=Marasmius crinis-equi TaxID=585013 RepID=A0ABR3FWM1_9AGAR
MELPRSKRKLLIFVFTGSTATLAAALVHNVYVLERISLLNLYTTHYEAAVALIVCNFHIVVPSIYSRISPGDASRQAPPASDSDELSVEQTTRMTQALTTNGATLTVAFTDITQNATDISTCDSNIYTLQSHSATSSQLSQ